MKAVFLVAALGTLSLSHILCSPFDLWVLIISPVLAQNWQPDWNLIAVSWKMFGRIDPIPYACSSCIAFIYFSLHWYPEPITTSRFPMAPMSALNCTTTRPRRERPVLSSLCTIRARPVRSPDSPYSPLIDLAVVGFPYVHWLMIDLPRNSTTIEKVHRDLPSRPCCFPFSVRVRVPVRIGWSPMKSFLTMVLVPHPLVITCIDWLPSLVQSPTLCSRTLAQMLDLVLIVKTTLSVSFLVLDQMMNDGLTVGVAEYMALFP